VTATTKIAAEKKNNFNSKDHGNLAKGGITVASRLARRLHSPGDSIRLTVWPQFTIACFTAV